MNLHAEILDSLNRMAEAKAEEGIHLERVKAFFLRHGDREMEAEVSAVILSRCRFASQISALRAILAGAAAAGLMEQASKGMAIAKCRRTNGTKGHHAAHGKMAAANDDTESQGAETGEGLQLFAAIGGASPPESLPLFYNQGIQL